MSKTAGVREAPSGSLSDLTVEERTLTLHGVLHVLSEHVPHDFCTDLPHIEFLWKPGAASQKFQSSFRRSRPAFFLFLLRKLKMISFVHTETNPLAH